MTKFQTLDFYQPPEAPYSLLPLRFTALNDHSYVVTNLAGEYRIVNKATFHELVQHKLPHTHPDYIDLRSRHFHLFVLGEHLQLSWNVPITTRYE